MERRALRRTIAVATLALAGVGAVLWWRARTAGARDASAASREGPPPPKRVVPEGTRIRVEVLNTTAVRGLGRKATLYLRDLGFDVVRFAGEGPQRDSVLVIDRTGHPEWAATAAKALGGARVEARPDSSRYVDLTVLIGTSWRAPAKPLYP